MSFGFFSAKKAKIMSKKSSKLPNENSDNIIVHSKVFPKSPFLLRNSATFEHQSPFYLFDIYKCDLMFT